MANIKIPRESIIDAAFEITKEQGIEAATAAAIAKRLNISERPIFWAFDTIENVRSLVLKKAIEFYVEFMDVDNPGITKATSVSLNYIRFARDYQHLFDFIYAYDKAENIDATNARLDGNRPRVLQIIKDSFNMNDEQAKEVYLIMNIYSQGIASLLKSKLASYTDDEIVGLLKLVFEKITK